ncbi:TetR family transcriptional regulator [Labrenzia sp. CE80]|uniref:TetR/AcrR family transcriptional regulator n=1 Tax=Labrenzia sp. CE80 TaxID=1788986 RepID=UPI00129B9D29|nr:TetR family transcriptional regulator [Labrenzia sp. CE80]
MADEQKRELILQAALDIMQTYGVKKFTQPQVAKAAGIRQSLLTYYFPKKIDLIKGLLQGHVENATNKNTDEKQTRDALRQGLNVLSSNQGRMRFFLSLILEAQLEPELKTLVDEHMTAFDTKIARYYGREEGDLDVHLFLSTLRGMGMRNLVSEQETDVCIDEISARFGLTPTT